MTRAPLVLRILSSLRSGRATVGSLAAALGVTRRSIERALAAIEASGIHIVRVRDDADRRVIWLRAAR